MSTSAARGERRVVTQCSWPARRSDHAVADRWCSRSRRVPPWPCRSAGAVDRRSLRATIGDCAVCNRPMVSVYTAATAAPLWANAAKQNGMCKKYFTSTTRPPSRRQLPASVTAECETRSNNTAQFHNGRMHATCRCFRLRAPLEQCNRKKRMTCDRRDGEAVNVYFAGVIRPSCTHTFQRWLSSSSPPHCLAD